MPDKKIIIVAGPTAVGKTSVAIKLAQYFRTEIISADSRQCYREMTIGTAKPDAEELSSVPHYFVNSHSVTEELNAGDYERLALGYCADIFQEKNIAVVCGGTGLYLKALCEGIDEMPKTDRSIETALQLEYEEKGIVWLRGKVSLEDPEFYKIAEQQNPVRLIRALAFKRSIGQSIVHFRSATAKIRPFDVLKIGLELPRQQLYDRINERVDHMMLQGLLEEAMPLYPKRHLKNLQTVGYSEIFEYMNGKTTLEQCIALIKQHSRNYAKRQLTWFKKDQQNKWFSPDDVPEMISYLETKVR